LEVILGIRPEPGGWRVDPCIPKTWPGFEVTLRDRTTTYRIRVENPHLVNGGVESIALDGKTLLDSVLPRLQDGRVHDVVVQMRPAGDDRA
jgi:cellobiose phosphorylase